MSKNYTQSTASLKTVTHDTYLLDAQKIMIYSGEGDRNSRIDLMDSINEQDTKIDNLSLVINDVSDIVSDLEDAIGNLGGDYGEKASDNTWTGANTFSSSVTLNGGVTSGASSSVTFGNNFSVLPLGTTTALGAPACGLHVSSTGGVQIWGTHFLQGDEWTDNALKIQHRNLGLYGDHTAPTTLTFDNANTIEFKVMPNDGSIANDGQGAIFDFSAWQWDNDSHTTKNGNCPVQILKNNSGSLTDRSLLNKSELDSNYASKSSYDSFVSSTNSSISTINTTLGTTAKTNAANTFTAANTFNSTATIKGAATFNSTITKSTTTSSPTNTSVLNKGETDALYAPKSLSTTVTNLSNTVNGLGSTYVAKTTYDSFVSSTNSSISTLNTNVGKCALKTDLNSYVKSADLTTTLGSYAKTSDLSSYVTTTSLNSTLGSYAKTGSANTFTAANTFNSTATVKGAATFDSTITKSTTTSSPTNTSVLNKGETDALYAPKSLADTVGDIKSGVTTISTIIASHEGDTSMHISSTERDGLATLISEKDNFAKKSECDELYAPKSLSTTVTNLSNTVNGLGSTYVAKTTYDSFVTSTNNSISTLNTNVGKCALKTDLNSYVTTTSLNTTLGSYATTASLSAYAKVGSANTFTAANTFNSTTTTKGAATFNSTITKTATTSSPADTAVLNKGENDSLYAPKSHVSDTSVHMSAADRETLTEVIEIAEELTTTAADFAKKNVENTFVKPNTFKESITTEGGINAMGGDIFVANGIITFEDLIDGTVVERSGASGYQYVEGIPTKFNNGVCYDIGTISDTTNLSAITFSSEGRLVQTCELWFKTPATVPTTHQWPANIYWIDSATGAAPTLIASKNYRLVFRQEPNKIIASIAYLY